MSESLQDHMMIEPGLTEAVRIVLKYEIQSLLSRLADTGEEYIVLTARSDDRTCGHISTEKGEDFVLNSSVQNVKEEFLNFCTGEWLPRPPEQKNPSQSLLPKQHRRKSKPRCKFQATSQDTSTSGYILDGSLPFSSSSEGVNSAEPATALDLSERKPQVQSSMPIDYSNDSTSVNSKPVSPENTNTSTPEYTMHDSLSGVDSRENSNIPVMDSAEIATAQLYNSVGYSWQEEKFNIKSEEFLPGHDDSAVSTESYNMVYSDGNQQNIADDKSSQNSFLSEDLINGGSPSSSQMNAMYNSRTFKPKRKARRSQTKNKQEEFAVTASYIPGSGAIEEAGENSFNASVNEEDSDGSFMQSENKMIHPGFTDMKSAFEEIGNMAKCLICNKVLANKNNRTFHWRSHVGDKRYTCDICNKAFTHPSNMRSHRKIHTDEKPFPCELCERRFRRRDYLLQHLERFHYNPKQSETQLVDDSYLTVSSGLIESNISG